MNTVLNDNIKTFSDPRFVEEYTHDYLRSSEKMVIDSIQSGQKVLDLGCGAGRTTKHIKKKGADVVGVDLSESLIKKAKELHPDIEFKVMDALDLKFPDRTFDLVFFSFNGIDNIFPLTERKKALFEIKRVLKNKGIFAYSSHNSLSMPRTSYGLKNLIKNAKRLKIGHHYREELYEFGKLIQYYNNVWSEGRILKKAGFKLIKILVNGKVNFFPWPLKFFLERFPMYIVKK